MSIEPIPRTAAGWPYLPDNAPIADQPAYTQALAAALAGFTPGASAPVADTGWVNATALVALGVGVTAAAAGFDWKALSYRRIGSEMWWNGLINLPANTAAEKTLFTIPDGLRPSAKAFGGHINTAGAPIPVTIASTGIVSAYGTWGAVGFGLSLHYLLG